MRVIGFIIISLATFFNRLAKKARRGRAISNNFGLSSARKTSFTFFNQGYRPSLIPPLGVTKETIFRYYQDWKHRDRYTRWQLFRKILRNNPSLSAETATILGISVNELKSVLKNCRSAEQAKKRLNVPIAKELDVLSEVYLNRYLARLLIGLSRHKTLGDKLKNLQVAAKAVGLDMAELLNLIFEQSVKLRVQRKRQSDLVMREILSILKNIFRYKRDDKVGH